MKKTFAGLFTALALTLGFVAASGGAASAVDYPPTSSSQISSTVKSVKAGKSPVVTIKSGIIGKSASGVAKVQIVKGPKGLTKALKKSFNKAFKSGKLTLPAKNFKKPGTYKVKLTINKVVKTITIKIKKK